MICAGKPPCRTPRPPASPLPCRRSRPGLNIMHTTPLFQPDEMPLPVPPVQDQPHCPSCGAQLRKRQPFCPFCGVRIDEAVPPAPVQAQQPEPEPMSAPEQPFIPIPKPAPEPEQPSVPVPEPEPEQPVSEPGPAPGAEQPPGSGFGAEDRLRASPGNAPAPVIEPERDSVPVPAPASAQPPRPALFPSSAPATAHAHSVYRRDESDRACGRLAGLRAGQPAGTVVPAFWRQEPHRTLCGHGRMPQLGS